MKGKKITALLALCALALCLVGCGDKGEEPAVRIGFSGSVGLSEIRSLNGKRVTAVGYMATLSPVNGKYMYLMNMPYQSCPFCVPNTQELANTLAVYAPEGKSFEFTDRAIRVTGTMRVEDSEDEFGYKYNYRITDAEYEIVQAGEMSEKHELWQEISREGLAADVNASFDYLHFVCCWPTYFVDYTGEDGTRVFYYLWPGDAENILKDDGPSGYAKQSAEDFYPSLARRADAFECEETAQLSAILSDCDALKREAMDQFAQGAYSFDEANETYELTHGQELYDKWYALYARFSDWMGNWEM